MLFLEALYFRKFRQFVAFAGFAHFTDVEEIDGLDVFVGLHLVKNGDFILVVLKAAMEIKVDTEQSGLSFKCSNNLSKGGIQQLRIFILINQSDRFKLAFDFLET